MEVVVESAMGTPDGRWRVEVVRRQGQRTRWYRIVRVDAGGEDALLDWLSISAVERILSEAGVDMATLVAADDDETDVGQVGPTTAYGAA